MSFNVVYFSLSGNNYDKRTYVFFCGGGGGGGWGGA